MKARIRVFSLVVAIAISGIVAGCAWLKQDATTVAINTEGVVIPTVNAVMEGWAAHVKAGKANQAQVDAVKGAYQHYYRAQLTASNTFVSYIQATEPAKLKADLEASNKAATDTKATLVNLITSYQK